MESIAKTTKIDTRMKSRLNLYLMFDFKVFLYRHELLLKLSSFIGLLKSPHFLKAQNLVIALAETLRRYPGVERSQTQQREENLIPKVQQPEKIEDPNEKRHLLMRSSSTGELLEKERHKESLRRSLSEPTTSSQASKIAKEFKPSKQSGQEKEQKEKAAPTKLELEKKKDIEIPKDLMKVIKETMECLEEMIKNLKSLKSFSFQNQNLFSSQFWASAGIMEMQIDDLRHLLIIVEKRNHINKEMMEDWMTNMANYFNLQNLKAGFGNYLFYVSRNVENVKKRYFGNKEMLKNIMKVLLFNDDCIEHLLELVNKMATLLQMNKDDAFVKGRHHLVELLKRIKAEKTLQISKSPSVSQSGVLATGSKSSPTTEKK
ncbi:hypothetical protein EIN_529960 [Entamoeba invadens IP1]|uniref:Uncharacterized protein n=1 Tax=Entamoeba invadens IP1 TaxID=370355 RepID=L7FNN8_ENTIV|nr:hypothetical protein EIN_529960 [Entamoeba invadens IP1]ELP88706.1 hypothetical protein EIN_529960 [Entamoeba invadens IP1]|eukprot:XP_004255477.1 hypothetical protein EIN_529960 [Entamoeba invadens IP1]